MHTGQAELGQTAPILKLKSRDPPVAAAGAPQVRQPADASPPDLHGIVVDVRAARSPLPNMQPVKRGPVMCTYDGIPLDAG
jgi:hypothetical protein